MVEMNVGDQREIDLWQQGGIKSRCDVPLDNHPDVVGEERVRNEDLVLYLDEDRSMAYPRDGKRRIIEDRFRDCSGRGVDRLTHAFERARDHSLDISAAAAGEENKQNNEPARQGTDESRKGQRGLHLRKF